ncbi:MAG TPA: hypothetical protein GX721_00135 [Firmicutes bacterium]|nr:hypothetical protein [Bacillota bacterium]
MRRSSRKVKRLSESLQQVKAGAELGPNSPLSFVGEMPGYYMKMHGK